MARRAAVAVVVLCGVLGAALPVAPAQGARQHPAGGGDAIVSSGTCSGSSGWIMAARAKNRGILLVISIRGGRPGGPWRIEATHNGRRIPTARPGGGRHVARPTPNLPGIDTYAFVARNRLSQETCSGALSY